MRVPLTVGAYTARSVIAEAQRCVNLYAEKNPGDAVQPYTHYLTPGLSKLGFPAQSAPVRMLYRATNNELFSVVGDSIYFVDTDWTTTLLGTVSSSATTPCKATDNGETMIIVDGSASGWTIDLATHAYAVIGDVDFYGSDFAEFVDTYMVFNKPGTNIFYISDSNTTSFDPLFFGVKTGYADKIAGLCIQQRQVWLIGQLTTEIWFDAGGTDFPFQIMPGPFVEHGCVAPYSIAKQGGSVFWLSQDLDGTFIAVQTEGYKAKEISTDALESEWSTYSTVTDAIGFCYQQLGHPFYWLKFPTAGKDWVYDLSTGLWHERVWLNPDTCGAESHRANCTAFAYGVNVVGDRENGQLYMLDPNNFTDAGDFIKRVRGFPHLMNDGKRVIYSQFLADMEAGNADGAGIAVPVLPNSTDVPVFTTIDTTFTAADDTLLENYANLDDAGSQYTRLDSSTALAEGKIESNQLSGAGGDIYYLASGVPTAADYVAYFQAIPDGFGSVPTNGVGVWMVGRAVVEFVSTDLDVTGGYKVSVLSNGSTYELTLEIMGGSSTTVDMGTLDSGYYEVFLAFAGNVITASAQRSQDSEWLSTVDNTWQADYVAAISITDVTYNDRGRVVIGGNWP